MRGATRALSPSARMGAWTTRSAAWRDSRGGERSRERVMRMVGPVPAITIASEAQADELGAALHAEMPWMGPGDRKRLARHAPRGSRRGAASRWTAAARRASGDRQDDLGASAREGPGPAVGRDRRVERPGQFFAGRRRARLGDRGARPSAHHDDGCEGREPDDHHRRGRQGGLRVRHERRERGLRAGPPETARSNSSGST